MSEEKKRRGESDTERFINLIVTNYDRLIEEMTGNRPSREGLMRRTKEEWAKAGMSHEDRKAALAILEALYGEREAAAAAAGTAPVSPDIATVVGVPVLAPPTPSRAGEALIGLFCKREMREAVLGDLDEKFAELAERRGANFAKAWYWSQAARSVLFFAVRWGRRLLELEAILKRIL